MNKMENVKKNSGRYPIGGLRNPEMKKLKVYLEENGFDYEIKFIPWYNPAKPGFHYGDMNDIKEQILVYDQNKQISWDAIWGYGSYGFEDGLLEVMGEDLIGHDDVEGYCTAEDIIEMIEGERNNDE
jgi:hypothetical protein